MAAEPHGYQPLVAMGARLGILVEIPTIAWNRDMAGG